MLRSQPTGIPETIGKMLAAAGEDLKGFKVLTGMEGRISCQDGLLIYSFLSVLKNRNRSLLKLTDVSSQRLLHGA